MDQKKFISLLVRYIFYIFIIVFFVFTIQQGYYLRIFEESDTFFMLFKQHIIMVTVSSSLALIVAIPLGIIVTRKNFRKIEWLATGIANLGQTIPIIAVLALMMSVLGLGFKTAVFALFIYSILPIYRNTVEGLNSVDHKMIDAANGMGMKPIQILFRIELPLAVNTIMGGIRTAIIINIGSAAMAFLVGGGGLGDWIFTGLKLTDNATLFSGAVPVTLLAIGVDYVLRGIQFIVTPKGLKRSAAVE